MAGITVGGTKGESGTPGAAGIQGPQGVPGIIGPTILVLKPKLGKIIGKIAVAGGWVVVYDSV